MAMNTVSAPLGQWIATNIGQPRDLGFSDAGDRTPPQYSWKNGVLTNYGSSEPITDYNSVLGSDPTSYFANSPQWQQAGVTYNPSTGMVSFPQEASSGGLLGGFLDFAQIPLTFAALAMGGAQFPGTAATADTSGFLSPEATNLVTQTGSNLATQATGLDTLAPSGMSFAGPSATLSVGGQSLPLSGPAGFLNAPTAGQAGLTLGGAGAGAASNLITDPNTGMPTNAPAPGTQLPAPVETITPTPISNILPGAPANLGNLMAVLGAGGAGLSPSTLASSTFGSIFGSGGGGGGLGSGIFGGYASPFSTALDIGSGLYGLERSKRMEDLAKMALTGSNNPLTPAAITAGRQLNTLLTDPSSVTSLPGYQFGMDQGIQAIMRQGAATGSGGNESIALARYAPQYAGQFYNSYLANLAQIGQLGAPNLSAGITAESSSANLASQALASLGYGFGGRSLLNRALNF